MGDIFTPKTTQLAQDKASVVRYTSSKLMSNTKRIFFVGSGLLQDVVERMLSDQLHVEIIGSAQTWEAAKAQIATTTPNVVIMAHQNTELSDAELNEAELSQISHPIKIIYLTPAENRIVVHDRQQISDAALPDLIEALNYGETQE